MDFLGAQLTRNSWLPQVAEGARRATKINVALESAGPPFTITLHHPARELHHVHWRDTNVGEEEPKIPANSRNASQL